MLPPTGNRLVAGYTATRGLARDGAISVEGRAMGLLDKLFGGGKKDSGPTLTYKVGVSETCRSVAKKFYGDESQWEKVYKPNEWRLKEEVQSGTDKLLPGTELTIKGAKFGLDGQPL